MSDVKDAVKLERYFVDQRCGCIAVSDRTLTDPQYQGLHHDTEGVVWYRHGEREFDNDWHVSEAAIEHAYRLCNAMNRKAEQPAPVDQADRIASLEAENAALEARLESACKKVVRLEAAQSAENWGDNAKLHNRITELEGHNAALQTDLDSLRAIIDSEHETFLQELILTAYGNAPFGTDHAKVVADAKAMLRAVEGGAV